MANPVGIWFNSNPSFVVGNIWNVVAAGSDTGTYIQVNDNINAFISYGLTVDGNSENDDNIWFKLQYSDTNGASWNNILNSTVTVAISSQTPDYYGNSGSIMLSIQEGWLLRVVAWGTDSDLDIVGSSSNGSSFLSILKM